MAKLGGRSRDKTPSAPTTKSDAYVGMLALALIAQIAGAVFLYLDYDEYKDKKPPMPQARPPVAGVKQVDPGNPPPPAPAPAPPK